MSLESEIISLLFFLFECSRLICLIHSETRQYCVIAQSALVFVFIVVQGEERRNKYVHNFASQARLSTGGTVCVLFGTFRTSISILHDFSLHVVVVVGVRSLVCIAKYRATSEGVSWLHIIHPYLLFLPVALRHFAAVLGGAGCCSAFRVPTIQ